MKFILKTAGEINRDRIVDLGFDGILAMKGGKEEKIVFYPEGDEIEVTEDPNEASEKALVVRRPDYKVRAKLLILEYMPMGIREIHQFRSPVLIDGINDVSLFPKLESMKPLGIITQDKNYVETVKKVTNRAK
ncbi:hypothetical protein [Sulfuracidifex tepidarius]|uniref:Uncharacterized protein n=1 Tax=Sulfuracidifex tepidarius TaxID=1294262 RepID=A0A510E4T4_9CREN|nr:hypothetical protein [Sulfuracidifex tepidarius]BBG24669.1 hypothetical protein IC006_2003 [Sulfuracidifex tepidarius]BBG27457.1 hypothetical protein IC007_2011 [Sulfuracidifex tepidarius]